MPALGSGSGKSAAGERRAKRKPRAKPYTRPAPAVQPGPYRAPERKAVARTQRKAARTAGPPTPSRQQRVRQAAGSAGQSKSLVRQGLASPAEVRAARLALLRKRNRGSGVRLISHALRMSTGASNVGNSSVSHRAGLPGAAAEYTDRSGGLGYVATRATRATAGALREDPVGTAKGTARGVKDMALGAVPGLVSLGVETVEGTSQGDPLRGFRNSGAMYLGDAARRYGPLTKPGESGIRAFKERIKKEGLAAEGADATILLTGAGGAASRGLGSLARRGRLGARAERVAAEPRARSRTSGGESREQELAPGLVKAAAQKRRDAATLRGQQRHVRRTDERAARRAGIEVDGRPARGEVDAVVREATARGEVVPSRVAGLERRGGARVGLRRAPSQRKLEKGQRVAYARAKGRTLHATRREQRQEGVAGGGRGAGRAYAALDRNERRAYKTALQLNPKSPAAGKAAVERRIAQIEAERARTGHEPAGTDELATLRRIAAEPEKHFTPRLREIVGQERARGARVAEGDPGLGDTPGERAAVAEARRAAPQFSLLGVTRGGTPIREAERAARGDVRKAKAQRRRAGVAVERETRRAARERGRAQLLSEQGAEVTRKQIERADRAVAIHVRSAANHRRRAQRARSEDSRQGHEAHARAAEKRAQAASSRRDELVAPRRRSAPDTAWFKPRPNAREPKHGRGMIDSDGQLHTWQETEGHHDEMRRSRGVVMKARLSVRPDGTVVATNGVFPGRFGEPMGEAEAVARAVAQDPRLKPTERMASDPEYQAALHDVAGEYEDRHERTVPKRAVRAEERAGRAQNRLETAKARREAIRDDVKEARARVRRLRGARGRGIRDVNVEPLEDFLSRGRAAAAAAELEEPAYFASQPRETVRRSLFTSGGFRSVPKDKRYSGKLFAEGREDASFTTYAQGLARNIKRKHNWNLVSDTVHEHAFEWGRNRSVEELRKELERRGVDPSTVAFWSPGVFKEARRTADEGDVGAETAGRDALGDLTEGEAVLQEAVRLAQDTGRFGSSRDWVVVPKGVLDEIEADTRPSGWFGRSLDVFKGKQARILLGTSPAWLQFQIASNMLLTTMAGVGPFEIVRAQRWWRKLSDEEKAAVEPYVGVGHFHDSLDQVRLGATADNRIVNAYRAFKANPFWHKPRKPLRGAAVSQLNPLDAMFRLDNAQNNAFRRAVLYNRVKRDAYARMGQNVSAMQRAQDRLIGQVLGHGDAHEVMRGLIADRATIEKHAEAVRDFLGDYETYTARERRTLGRATMFYGYLRFSLRFVFYTMPVKHPTMTAIIGQLGRLQTEETRRLLGGDELPWAMGKFYYSSGGKLRSVDVARANPFLNTLTNLDPGGGVLSQARNLLQFLPPVYVALANQAFSKSSFRNRAFRVDGETQGRPNSVAAGKGEHDYTEGQRGRIFLNELARLVAIYRIADTAAQGGVPQGDDSLLGDRPTQYKRSDIVAGINESRQRFEDQGGFVGSVKRSLLPLVPREDTAPQAAAAVRAARGKPAGTAKLDPEQQRLIAAYGSGAAGMSQAEIDRLLKAYGP